MENLRILLVEDNDSDIEACTATIKRYERQNSKKIECITAKSKEDAFKLLDSSFDGAIIDIRLTDNGTGTEGNDVIAEIHKNRRIPLVILTATPATAYKECDFLKCYKKGEVGYEEIFNHLYEIYNTGLTKILGARGIMEDAMHRIFWAHLLPQLNSWKEYNAAGTNTEQSILRLILYYLLELLETDAIPSHPEEMYITPSLSDDIKTGSIIKKKDDDKYHIVLSPPCDLVIRANGNCKTDKILIVEIVPYDVIKEQTLSGVTSAEKRKNKMIELLKNNVYDYYHCLPPINAFNGGFINFRWIKAVEKNDIISEYNKPIAKLTAPFVKEVISRFATFYARQGQPDFDFNKLASISLSA